MKSEIIVTAPSGLCKLATPAEIEAQEFSLNPGRYVGIVIEDDENHVVNRDSGLQHRPRSGEATRGGRVFIAKVDFVAPYHD